MKDYLKFTRTDRIGLLGLSLLILLILFLPRFFPIKNNSNIITIDTTLIAGLSEKEKEKDDDNDNSFDNKNKYNGSERIPLFRENGELFSFDPNTLDFRGWQRLGLHDRIIRTLINYRNKGGHFYRKEDVRKIWGLPEAFYLRIEPYIAINGNQQIAHPYMAVQGRKIAIVEINSADTTAFIDLPGIASKLANRILTFRDRLGGFYSVEQIAETWGLSDTTFKMIRPYLRVNPNHIRQFSINQATIDELKTHPYIRWKWASLIVSYRNKNGLFTKIEDLKKIPELDTESFEKMRPYLNL